jgi:hypothetical protein
MKDDITNANGIDGNATKALYGVRWDGTKRDEIRRKRRDVASGATVKDERGIRRRGRKRRCRENSRGR